MFIPCGIFQMPGNISNIVKYNFPLTLRNLIDCVKSLNAKHNITIYSQLGYVCRHPTVPQNLHYITCTHFLRVLAYLGFYILLGHCLMFLVFRWLVDHEVASHLQMKIRIFLVVFFVVLHVSDPDSMTDFTFELRTFSQLAHHNVFEFVEGNSCLSNFCLNICACATIVVYNGIQVYEVLNFLQSISLFKE